MSSSFIHQVDAFVSDYVILSAIVLVDLSQIITVITLHVLAIFLVTLKSHAFIEQNFILILEIRSVVTLFLQEVLFLIIR